MIASFENFNCFRHDHKDDLQISVVGSRGQNEGGGGGGGHLLSWLP